MKTLISKIIVAFALVAFGGAASAADVAETVSAPAAVELKAPVYQAPKNKWAFKSCTAEREFYEFASVLEAAGLGHMNNTKRGGCVVKGIGEAGAQAYFGTVLFKPRAVTTQSYLFCAGSKCNNNKGKLRVAQVNAASAVADAEGQVWALLNVSFKKGNGTEYNASVAMRQEGEKVFQVVSYQ